MSNENRLYVGNLSDEITANVLRMRFERCGAVTDVELAFDRGSGRMRGFGFVTMANDASKKSALAQMNGAYFEDRQIRVSESNDEHGDDGGGGRMKKSDLPARRARITQQFRERANMSYELDCAGVPLAFKMYPTNDAGGKEDWRIEAVSKTAPEHVVQATAPTRRQAFAVIEKDWGPSAFDWRAIDEALTSVRAL